MILVLEKSLIFSPKILCEPYDLSGLTCLNKQPRSGGGLPYMGYIGMCCCEGYGFQAVYSRIGYINQSIWVQNRVSFFRKLIGWLRILSRLGTVVQTVLVNGGFGELTLAQGGKIQLNQLWYRSSVPGSQRHIPTQKFPEYPPPPALETLDLDSNLSFEQAALTFCLDKATSYSFQLMMNFYQRMTCLDSCPLGK